MADNNTELDDTALAAEMPEDSELDSIVELSADGTPVCPVCGAEMKAGLTNCEECGNLVNPTMLPYPIMAVENPEI